MVALEKGLNEPRTQRVQTFDRAIARQTVVVAEAAKKRIRHAGRILRGEDPCGHQSDLGVGVGQKGQDQVVEPVVVAGQKRGQGSRGRLLDARGIAAPAKQRLDVLQAGITDEHPDRPETELFIFGVEGRQRDLGGLG